MIKSLNIASKLQLLVASVIVSVSIAIPFAASKAGAVPAMTASMCRSYALTDASGYKWYKITAKFSNYTLTNASMTLSITLFDGRRFDHSRTSMSTTPSITTTMNFRQDSKATASISNVKSGAISTINQIINLPTCGSI